MTLDLEIARALGVVSPSPQLVCKIGTTYYNKAASIAHIPEWYHTHDTSFAIPAIVNGSDPWSLLIAYSRATKRWHVKWPSNYNTALLNNEYFQWAVHAVVLPPGLNPQPFKTIP